MEAHALESLQGCRILVVEDDFMVAQVLCDLLEDAGATVIGPIGWATEALAFVEDHSDGIDRAILDVNLHGETSYAIARALQTRNVRFAFATGYGAESLDEGFRGFPRCLKPFQQRDLLAVLS